MTYSILGDRKFKMVFTGWWIIWAALHFYMLKDYGFSSFIALTDSFVTNILLAGSCLVISNNMRYYLPGKEKYWYILVISIGLSLIGTFLQKLCLWLILKSETGYLIFVNQTMSIRFAEAFLLVGCMAALSLLWYTQQEQKETNDRKTEAEKMAREAELFKLRQQLQPHFLFNSLNSISALTTVQPEKARHMIQQLSEFLRGTLKKEEKQWITLQEELDYLQLYLEIEKVRFGHRLQTDIQFDDTLLKSQLPSFLLQPVVENAIKFGLYDTIGEVCISINATSSGNDLLIEVQNPFDAETAQPLQGTGFGLGSIKRRLFLLFARTDLLKTAAENNLFITTILIPQPHESINH